MSRWAPKAPEKVFSSVRPSLRKPVTRLAVPFWVKVLPFLLSSLLFMSGLLTVFTPLPLLFSFFHSGRKWAWFCFFSNVIIVAILGNLEAAAIFAGANLIFAMFFGEALLFCKRLEIAFFLTLVLGLTLGLAGVFYYLKVNHLVPLEWAKTSLAYWIEKITESVSSSRMIEATDLEDWRRSLMVEFPSAIVSLFLVVLLVNFIMIFRLNPGSVRKKLKLSSSFLSQWKAPEHLVWPTLAAGALVLFELKGVTDVAINVFKVLMVLYFFQGISIMTFWFDRWQVKGIFRSLLFLLGIFLGLPMVLSIGFFDLWFDFRSKFRQS